MTNKEIERVMNEDLRDAAKTKTIIYLEGRTDKDLFFSLLGKRDDGSNLLNGVLIRGIHIGGGGGSRLVKRFVEIGASINAKIVGLIDGDGERESFTYEIEQIDSNPSLHAWRSYCIENMVAKTVWPSGWGDAPDWADVMLQYTPYVAFNRLMSAIAKDFRSMDFKKYRKPSGPLMSNDEFETRLKEYNEFVDKINAIDRFRKIKNDIEEKLRRDINDAHAWFNGKWLVEHYARRRTEKSIEKCREEWADAVRESGGNQNVIDWWDSVIKVPIN